MREQLKSKWLFRAEYCKLDPIRTAWWINAIQIAEVCNDPDVKQVLEMFHHDQAPIVADLRTEDGDRCVIVVGSRYARSTGNFCYDTHDARILFNTNETRCFRVYEDSELISTYGRVEDGSSITWARRDLIRDDPHEEFSEYDRILFKIWESLTSEI